MVCVFFALALASAVYASYDGFSDIYYKNFNEGDETVFDLKDLDIVRFTYDDMNYSVRLMGIYSETVRIIVTHKYFDLQLSNPLDVDLDSDDEGDLTIELEYMDPEQAGLRLGLKELEEPEPDPPENTTNTTNSTSTNSTNSTNTTSNSNNSDTNSDDSNNDDNNTISQNTTTTSNSNTQNTSTQSSKSNKATGDVVYNVNIDITIPPGSGVGVLLILAIVLGGLFVYKKVKRKYGDEDTEIEMVSGKKAKKQPKMKKEEPKKINREPVDVKKAVKKFARKTGKSFTKGRKRFAEMIAGDGFVRKPKP